MKQITARDVFRLKACDLFFYIVGTPQNIVIESYSQIPCILTLGYISISMLYISINKIVDVVNDNLLYFAIGIHVEI